jgi:hypothetical protein
MRLVSKWEKCNAYRILKWKPVRKGPLGRPTCRRNYIQMDHKTNSKSASWINPARDKKRGAVVKKVMTLRVP